MAGPGAIGGNRPTNNIVNYPSTSPNANLKVGDPELNAHGQFVAEQQAANQPRSGLGAAFSKMAAAVSKFFKSLTDRQPSIENPSQPRVSPRRQEVVQAGAAAPQRPADPFEAAMGGKPVSTKVRADFTAFAQVASAPGTTNAKIIDHVLALPKGNAVAMAYDTLATERMDQPNLQVMKALRSEEGLSLSHLVSNFVKPGSEQELNLFHKKGLVASIVDINGKLNQLGLKDAVVRQVPNENGSGFSLQVSSPRGAVGGEAIGLLRQMEVQVGILAGSVHDEMSSQLKSMKGGGLMDAVAQRPEQKLFRAGLAALGEGAAAVGNAAASSQAEIGKLDAMSTLEFAEALQADPSLARHMPQMSADSPARQEYENFVANQTPMSRQAATEGFYEMVKASVIHESLSDAGLIGDEPADDLGSALDRLASASPTVKSKSAENALSSDYFKDQHAAKAYESALHNIRNASTKADQLYLAWDNPKLRKSVVETCTKRGKFADENIAFALAARDYQRARQTQDVQGVADAVFRLSERIPKEYSGLGLSSGLDLKNAVLEINLNMETEHLFRKVLKGPIDYATLDMILPTTVDRLLGKETQDRGRGLGEFMVKHELTPAPKSNEPKDVSKLLGLFGN